MIVLEIATIGEIEFLEFATLSEIRDSFTVYKTQPVDRGRPRYQLTTLSVSQIRRVMSSAAASRAGVRDTGRREGAAGNTAGAGSVRQSSHISRDVCLQASPLGGGAVP